MPKGRGFDGRVALPTVASSEVVAYQDGTTITTAKIIATYTGEIIFKLSADDGSNWEDVTNKVKHTFTNTGEKLKWKAIGKYPAELTVMKVEYNK